MSIYRSKNVRSRVIPLSLVLRVLGVGLVFSNVSAGVEPICRYLDPFAYYRPHLEIHGRALSNSWVPRYRLGYNFFLPLPWVQSHGSLFFSELGLYDSRDRHFNSTDFNVSVHLGYRRMREDQGTIYGVYIALDHHRRLGNTSFKQIAVGTEMWVKRLFFTINAYAPIGKIIGEKLDLAAEAGAKNDRRGACDVSCSSSVSQGGGVDGEVGYELVPGLVGYVGGRYRFEADKRGDQADGLHIRLSYEHRITQGSWLNFLGFEIGLRDEAERGNVVYGLVRIRLGLTQQSYGHSLTNMEKKMVALIHRDMSPIPRVGGAWKGYDGATSQEAGGPGPIKTSNETSSFTPEAMAVPSTAGVTDSNFVNEDEGGEVAPFS